MRLFVPSVVIVFLVYGPATSQELRTTNVDQLAGQPADVSSSAYQYRADRKPEANSPESWIALIKYANLPFDKAVDANTPALKKVLCSLLWEEVRCVRRVVLAWDGAARRIPKPEEVALSYFDAEANGNIPTWWNPTVVREAGKPQVSADGHALTFTIPADTFGLVVSLRGQEDASACDIPQVRSFVPEAWKRMDLEIEWGFDKGTSTSNYSGRIEAYDGIVDRVRPLAGDTGTTMKGPIRWQSSSVAGGRRGVSLGLLYLGTSKDRRIWPYNAELDDVARTIITVWTKAGNFSFLASDLEKGPILAPEYGFFVRAKSPPKSTAPIRQTLSERVNVLPGVPKVRGWADHGLPWFGVNSDDQPGFSGSLTVPARCAALHPAPDRDVAVGWQSPIRGRVRVTGKLAMGDSQGGNGIEWWLIREGKSKRQVLARGAVGTGEAQSLPTNADAKKGVDVTVEAGDMLSMVVGAKGGDHVCDTTIVELQITEVGGKGRDWNLAKDATDRIHAGNPHADGLGNVGVWHFYACTVPSEPSFGLRSNAKSAREFLQELAAKGLKTTRQRVRQHPEQTWDEAVAAMFPGKTLPAIPKPEYPPPMKVEVPCEKLTAQWNLGAWHLARHAVKDPKGQLHFNDHPYGILAAETYLVLRTLDLVGMHKAAADGLDQWLGLPLKNGKPTGLFSEGNGCMTNAVGPPGAGGNMDGIHGMGPGAIMFALTEHFALTGDGQWLKASVPRMKANVQWILRQRQLLSEVIPGGKRLWCKGLQPAHQVTPDSGGQLMQFYESEAYYWLAVQRFARILAQVDAGEGTRLAAEAETYRKDLKAAVERSIAQSPVVLVRDGTYRSFIPFACYVRGFSSGAWSWRRPGSGAHVGGLYWDTIQSAEPLVSPAAIFPPDDRRVQGALDVLEDRLLLENPKVAARTPGFDPESDWFAHAAWQYQPGLERHANIHLAGNDVPSFLRSWLNQYAVLILPDDGYSFREHTTGGPPDKIFEEAAFLERFRQMLIMEEGDQLWLARATPRAWLAQGKQIVVQNAPTHFGVVTYRIVSSADEGKIKATVEMPPRGEQKIVLLRFRHPKATPIKSVTVNGQNWEQFDNDQEVIRLERLTGKVEIEARY
jgi:hypothetical protein